MRFVDERFCVVEWVNMPGREGQEGGIRINQRVISEQSQGTIKSLSDALVELVTNSDDSYRRLEQRGFSPEGRITVFVHRHRGGVVSEIEVSDWAEGMTLQRIEEVLEFGADHSGFSEGGNIRGLFGKGLKEAVFALGSGEIESVRNGAFSCVSLWQESLHDFRWRIEKDQQPCDLPDGTTVRIAVTNPDITSPTWTVFKNQFQTHFALRDICSLSRIVELKLRDVRTTNSQRAVYAPPQLLRVVDRDIPIEGLGSAHLIVEESEYLLHFLNRDPCSIAGIIVRTEGIPLDSRFFGFENETAAQYFTGSVEVPGIAQSLRGNDLTILAPSRSGLDWRSNNAQRLHLAVQNELRVLVDRKRRELESARRTATREVYRERLRDVCRLLNRLAEEEIEDIPPFGPEEPITGLTIIPSIGYARPREQRRFSIYLPRDIADSDTARVSVSLEDIIGDIRATARMVTLAPQRSNPAVLAGSFTVSGAIDGASCLIFARWRDAEDIAEFRVREPVERPQPPVPPVPPAPRGLFRDIQFDETPSPIQRVSFNHGEIRIYLNFPTMRNYLGPGGDGMDTPLGGLMCAELIAEAFSREVARRRIDSGTIVLVHGGEIDAYNSERDTLSRKYLRDIHNAFVVD